MRRVDIHNDLQDKLAAYKAARGETRQSGAPAFLNARGMRWTRNAIAQHVIPPAPEEANRHREQAGLPAIREEVTSHMLRYRYVLQRRQRGEIGRRRQLAMHESAADVGREETSPTDV